MHSVRLKQWSILCIGEVPFELPEKMKGVLLASLHRPVEWQAGLPTTGGSKCSGTWMWMIVLHSWCNEYGAVKPTGLDSGRHDDECVRQTTQPFKALSKTLKSSRPTE